MNASELRMQVERMKGKVEQLTSSIKHLEDVIQTEKRNLYRHEKALEIVKSVGLATQKQLEYQLSEQVSLAMDAVFDDPYELKLNFQEKRGRTEVEILFARNELEFPPLGSAGGGAIDVAALALQIAYWSMRRDKKVRPVMLLDEPFQHLKGDDANQRALAIIREISHHLDLQMIMISDERVSRDLIVENADQVFVTSRNVEGVSTVIQESKKE